MCANVQSCAIVGDSRNTIEGESLTSVDKKEVQRSNWFFTWNNYSKDDIVQLCNYFDKFTFQEEVGLNGVRHLQGVVCKRQRFSTLKKVFPKVHWEVCKNIFAGKQYCMKLDTRNGKIYSEGMDYKKKIVIKDYFKRHVPYKWQKDVMDLIGQEPSERCIFWYWDKKGNVGKSSLTRHLIMNYEVLAVAGQLEI